MNRFDSGLYMIGGAFLNGGASLFLKYAALQRSLSHVGDSRFATLFFVVAAMLSYAGAFSLYYLALRRVDVGVAYLTMTSIAAIIVSAYGVFVFGEHFSLQKALGFILVAIGLFLLTDIWNLF